MSVGAPVAADVPLIFDVIVNGQGYMLERINRRTLGIGVHASYGYSPTFLTRQNVSDSYGDNQQDFFLTISQNDWSLGEGQRYLKVKEADRRRRFWAGTNVDPSSIPGQVTMRNTVASLTFAGAVRALAETQSKIYAANATNLYSVDSTGAIADAGAHGLGATPSQWGLTTDSSNVFVTTTTAGTVGVRKYTGAVWSTFSASGADALAYLNNTLYGYREGSGDLVRYATDGAVTVIYTWKDASGTALTGSGYASRLRPFGGKLLILRTAGVRGNGELWTYDGTNTSQIADFPASFIASDVEITSDIIFVSGYIKRDSDKVPAIWYYVNGTSAQLWKSSVAGYTNPTWPAMAAWGDGIAFTDDAAGRLMQYNLATGGVHTLGTYTVTNAKPMMAANRNILVHSRDATAAYYYPSTALASTATVQTSLIDFDNALTKQIRGIKVEWTAGSGGDGGSVDIAYQMGNVTGSYTSLQTGAVSGTEYTLIGVSGSSISVQVTLNKGTSTTGPILKRIYVRAAPLLQSYAREVYILNLRGRNGLGQVELQNGQLHPLDGLAQATNLRTAAASTTPISITSRFGTFTGIIENESFQLDEIGIEEFIATVPVRQV